MWNHIYVLIGTDSWLPEVEGEGRQKWVNFFVLFFSLNKWNKFLK